MSEGKKIMIIVPDCGAISVSSGSAKVPSAQTAGTVTSSNNILIQRVAAILGIEQGKLQSAFAQAKKEQSDQALTDYLNNLVEQNKITQQQADQYKQWWQSRPNVPVPGIAGHFQMPSFRTSRIGEQTITTPQ
jgi:hypothetical protein